MTQKRLGKLLVAPAPDELAQLCISLSTLAPQDPKKIEQPLAVCADHLPRAQRTGTAAGLWKQDSTSLPMPAPARWALGTST